jgi:hypothetical protein
MKKKFASFLIGGKAATLPFFASNSLADMPNALCMADCENVQIMGKCSDSNSSVMNVVITGLKTGDAVFVASSDNTEQLDPNFPDMKIGLTNLRFLTNFVVEGIDLGNIVGPEIAPYGEDNFSEGTYAVSVPVSFDELLNKPEGFYMQALIYRNDQALFSELDKVEVQSGSCISYDCDGDGGSMYGGAAGGGSGYGGICGDVSGGDDMYGGASGGDTGGGDDMYGGASGGDTGGGDDMYGGASGGGDTGGGDMYGGTGGDNGSGSAY